MRCTIFFTLALVLSACASHSPTSPRISERDHGRFIPSEYYFANYPENELYNGFPNPGAVQDLRYQYAILQDDRVQQDLAFLIRESAGHSYQDIYHFGDIMLSVKALSELYYFGKTKSLCRELAVKWTTTSTAQILNQEERIFCQLGAEQRWLPIS